ncbi:MAG TPA: TIGR00730 family Rossman fold protein, partial [Candidatus Yanofskybacteria bacterium]|nr:TIGR00730 family Rossman fold protein [Candidatus Yanofskybacteria bacterium]
MEKEKYNLPVSKLPIEAEELPDKDFRHSFHWRIFKIMGEFVEGWEFLADLKKSVTFFG